MDYFAIGQRIRKYRREKMLSQEELAEKVGISTTHMSHIETANTKLSLPVLVDIAAALGVTTDALLFDPPQNDTGSITARLATVLESCPEREKHILTDVFLAAAASLQNNRE